MVTFKRIVLLIALFIGAIVPALGQCTLSVNITATNNGIICGGSPVNLKANISGGTGPYSYLWSTSETTQTITVNKDITYTVTVSDNSGCPPVKESFTVIASSAPDAPTAAGKTVCKGTSATLTATGPGGGTYQWYDANGNFKFTGDTYVTPPITTSTTFYVETTVGSCTGPRTPVIVDITADPTVVGASICAGNQATLTASGGDTYKWYDAPNGNELAQGNTYSPTLTTTTTFYVVAITNGCTSNPVPVTANVTPFPQTPVPTTTSMTICAGTSANLHADVGDGGTISWYDVATGGQPLISSPDYTTPNLAVTTIYYAQNSLGECGSPRKAVTITVTSAPDAPTITPSAATACSGTSAVLTASSASGSNFAWYADATGTTPLPNNTTNPFVTPILTATTTYYVQTINGSCYSALVPVTITVFDNPVAPSVAPVAQVCPGSAATLSAFAPGGTYKWYDTATGGNLLFTGDTYNPVVTGNITFYVDVTNANGCVSTRTAVNVTTLPVVTPPTASPVTICYNTAATLTATGSDNYRWYDAATGGNLLSSTDTYTTPAPLTASTTYYVETTVNGCTSLRTAVNVTVTPIPQQPTVSGATNICPLTSTTLTASVTDGGTIRWYNVATGGTVLATGNTYTPTVNTTTTYYAENTLSTCVGPRAGVTVTTTPVNFPQFQYSSGTVCKTTPTFAPTYIDPAGGTFTASPNTLVINPTTGVINVSLSPINKYTVTFKSNNSCQTITSTIVNIVISPDANFTYTGGPYCQFGVTNPKPTFAGQSSAGKFTATPSGLVFADINTGEIDLQKSNPGNYTITNTIDPNGTCTGTSAFQSNIVINPGVEVNAGPNQAIKAGASATLAGTVTPTGTAVIWTTSGTGTFSNDASLTSTYTPAPGETSVTLTLSTTSPACGTPTDQITLTISPQPAPPTVTPPPSVCAGNTVTLTATAPGGTYEWFNVATGGTKVFTGSTFTTPPLSAPTTYWVQTTVGVNTSNRTAVNVIVNPLPAKPDALPANTCFNTPATLKVTVIAGNTYEWYATSSGGTAIATGDTYTTQALTGPASYYVQAVSSGGCPGPRTKVDVTIVQPPQVTSAATGSVCSGSVLSYTITSDAAAATYSWDRPAVAGISNLAGAGNTSQITETLVNTGSTPVKVTYDITVTAGSCSTVFKYAVTVNPFGSVKSPGTGGPICNGEPVNYSFQFSHPGVAFRWSRAAVPGISNLAVSDQAATTIKESLYNTTNAPINVTYVFTYNEGSCTGTFSYTTIVNPAIIVTSNTNDVACSGTALNYIIKSNIPSATFTWLRSATGPNPAVNNQTKSTIDETLINDGSFEYVVYGITPTAFGCQGNIFYLTVSVNKPPVAPVIYSNTPVCENKTISLSTPTVVGASYLWTGPNGFTSNQQNPQILNAAQTNGGTYNLVITTNGCPSPPTTVNVKVNALPTVTAGPDQKVCITQPAINITGIVNGGTTSGVWTSTGNGSFAGPQNQINNQYLPSAQDRANGTVTLTLTSSSTDDCTPATASTVITFGPSPSVDAGPDQEVCAQNTAVQLSGATLPSKTGPVKWTSSGTGSFTASDNQLNANYVPSAADIASGSVTLTLTYLNATACDVPNDEMIIKFIPPPMVNAGGTRYVLKDKTITLEPIVSDETVTYLWTPNLRISDNTIKNPVITGGDKDQVYTLTITDARGCTAKDSALIKSSPIINVPNTFTPNGDGVNDVWIISGMAAYTDAVVDVYNRYGIGLYHSIGYGKAWDGSYNGQPLPAGTYYYVIRLNAGGQILSGSITVIR